MVEILEFLYQLLYSAYEEVLFRLYYGPVFHRFLFRKYPYYTHLEWPMKLKFLRLVRDHYLYFEFVSRQKMKLTQGRKAIICSGASQLVMGLPSESLTFFKRIIVYPDFYTSTYTRRVHKGEVNPGLRSIIFSWRGIDERLKGKGEDRNLLIHEFGHALWLEHKLVGHAYTVLEKDWILRFEEIAESEMNNIRDLETHLFRIYAFSNIEEFFAVAVENFFERPARFKKEIPELYAVLMNILKQDPLKMRQAGKSKSAKPLNFNP